MKISDINIKSFGVIKDWKADIDDNLTVVYGDNETGKSTITEFIRSTLFPPNPNKKNLYPTRDQTDSGNITVKMDNGDIKVLSRKGKKVTEKNGKNTVADEFPGMNAETYLSVYGLDLDRLADMKPISKDVSKLLAIPGGENIPNVSKIIEDKLDSLMNKKSADSGTIGLAREAIKNASDKIANIHYNMNRYSQLVTEKDELGKKISEINLNRQKIMNDRAKKEVVRSQIDNLEKLKTQEKKLCDYDKYKDFPMESYSEYTRIKGNIDELNSKIEGKSKTDSKSIIEHRGDIENVWKHANQYRDDIKVIEECDSKIQNYQNEITQMEKDLGWTSSVLKNARTDQDIIEKSMAVKRKGITWISLLLIAMGITLIALYMGLGLAIVGAGIICMIYRLEQLKQWKKWIVMQGYPSGITPDRVCDIHPKLKKLFDLSTDRDNVIKEKNEYEQRVNEYTRRASSLLTDFNYTKDDIFENVNLLHNELEKADNSRNLYEQQRNEEECKLIEFLGEYGDEEGFLIACKGKKEYDRLNIEIKTLRQSIEESTSMKINDLDVLVNSDEMLPQLEDFDTGDMDQRIGAIKKEIRDIMCEGELDKQLQRKMKSENDLKESLREWAKLSLANSIIEDACNFFYDDLQPDVVKDANKYLSLMTGGRYKLDNDPRNKEPVIRDKDTKKCDKEWSSGLSDQVYLSLKMAIAKWSRDKEKLPLILDDVLVRFDNDRKKGACRAIYEFSKESQVIMFTCDNSLRDFFNNCGKHTEILLSDKSSFREVVAHE